MKRELSANTNLSHYRIVSKIGAGGMGEVYLAEDPRLRRKVALKVLPPEFTNDKQRLRRFEQEAQTASALNHPNIVTIYEVGAEDGLNFIVTEFIDGQTLRQKMRAGLLPLNEALDIAQQATGALVAAHEAGIVHRDIKPENIMVRPDGLAKVLDFGLAKSSAPAMGEIDQEAQTIAQRLTKPGMIMGTLHYMSPEQVRGLPLDARSDIFSLVAVIYEMLTGQGPFDRPTKGDVIAAILTETAPPLSQVKQGVPPELQRILAKGLQKDKENRYQTSKDLLIDIKSLTRELEFTSQMGRTNEVATHRTRPITARRFSLVQALAGVLVASLGIGAVWWFAFKRNAPTETLLPSSLKTAEVFSWRSTPGELYSIGSFSPDGMKVAMVSTTSGTRNIQVKQASANAPPVQTTKDEFNNAHPIWSPDGEEIAFFSTRGNQQGIWRIPYLGGSPTLIKTVEAGDTRPRYWSKTGVLYYQAKQNLFALEMKSGQTTQLTNFDATTATGNSISISPDEKRIAYITSAGELWSLWTVPAHGGAPRVIVNGATEIRNTVWHSDSRRLLYNALVDGVFQIFITDVDGNKPVQITFGDKDSLALDVSKDGAKILYGSSKEEADVWGVNLAKADEFSLTSDINSELWPNVSPNGKTVAFQSIRNLSQGDNLFSGAILTKPTDSDAPPTQLVTNGFLPTWSPDGSQLAFMRVVGDAGNVWTIKATGGEEKQLTTNGVTLVQITALPYNRVQASYISWSPDSNRIAYVANRSGASNVWLVSADGSNDAQLTNNSDAGVLLLCPLWSSDGKRIAYTSKLNKIVEGKPNYGVWVLEVETKVARVVLQSESFLRLLGWSEDEQGLVLAAVKGRVGVALTEVSLVEITFASAEQRNLGTQPSTYLYNIHLSPDRRTIAFVSNQDGKDNIWIIPSRGGAAKTLTANKDARLYFSSLAWTPDGKTIFFGKQSRYSLLTMITNFK
jgi:serine/threonine protein kinase